MDCPPFFISANSCEVFMKQTKCFFGCFFPGSILVTLSVYSILFYCFLFAFSLELLYFSADVIL